ncbi:MAG: phosphatase PAP2 family protein [Muribaculaceae bacterium]|nr:phosphatase PAP2 family protein [Muribaculaceae bacterium]
MTANKQKNRLIFNIKRVSATRYFILALILAVYAVCPTAMMAEDNTFSPSAAQKGIRTSTDVIAVALPATALAVTLIERDWEGLKQGALSAAVTAGVTLGLKYLVKETRPDFSNRHSFPSGHSAVTFAAATYIGKRYGWKWSIPAYALSAFTAWGRVYGKKHHWWDVAAGAAIGAASSFLFTHPYMRKHEVALVPAVCDTGAGAMLSFAF